MAVYATERVLLPIYSPYDFKETIRSGSGIVISGATIISQLNTITTTLNGLVTQLQYVGSTPQKANNLSTVSSAGQVTLFSPINLAPFVTNTYFYMTSTIEIVWSGAQGNLSIGIDFNENKSTGYLSTSYGSVQYTLPAGSLYTLVSNLASVIQRTNTGNLNAYPAIWNQTNTTIKTGGNTPFTTTAQTGLYVMTVICIK